MKALLKIRFRFNDPNVYGVDQSCIKSCPKTIGVLRAAFREEKNQIELNRRSKEIDTPNDRFECDLHDHDHLADPNDAPIRLETVFAIERGRVWASLGAFWRAGGIQRIENCNAECDFEVAFLRGRKWSLR